MDSLGKNIKSKRTFANVLVFCRVLGCTCGCEDKEPSRLPQATPNQRHSSTELSIKRVSNEKVSGGGGETDLLHNVQSAERAAEVNCAEDDLGDVGI